jgi:high-affinity iron transporter
MTHRFAAIRPARHVWRTCALIFGLMFAVWNAPAVAADDASNDVRQVWKLLDYIAVDYAEAVADGAIINEGEYAEMKEFAETALTRLSGLPARDGQQGLITQAEQLKAAIAAMSAPDDVARRSHDLANALLLAYPVPMTPAQIPDVARGAVIYAEKCASCHGPEGRGDGLAAEGMDPPPIAFTDHERARARSLFSLYEVATQGLDETSMTSFAAELSDDERWAVSFYIAGLSASPELRAQGETLWREDASVRAPFPNLESLIRALESGVAVELGADKAQAVMSYLRSDPSVVGQDSAGGLAIARARLAESLAAYQAGDAKRAGTLALASYLDGFEPVEALLRSRDADLLARVEGGMIKYRSQISAGAPVAEVSAQAQEIKSMFDATEATLTASEGDATAAFLGAYTILVREGIEALLVVVAMIGFLTKVERHDVLPYVHAGWASALIAGALTWAVAAYFVDISGANRELTEGISSLFAAVVLLAVGIWMHQKSLAGRWQSYIKEKLSAALSKKSAFFLFALAFVAVYREVFETILFYVALWTRGGGSAIFAGLGAGIVTLAVITVILLRTSRRLPITQFFAASSLLIAILAVVLAGKGFAALQEAGFVPAIAVNGPRFEAFGVYPSAVPLVAQATVLVIAIAGYLWNTRSSAAKAE